jgi:hypothetical protein
MDGYMLHRGIDDDTMVKGVEIADRMIHYIASIKSLLSP